MSYAFPIKSLPETRSSTILAVLASLGIHGLLVVVLPLMPFSSNSVGPVSQQTVGLVQLTPNELSRLPRASIPPVQLPAFATQPSALPPLPPPPSLGLLQQTPSGTTSYKDLLQVPSQPQFQTLAPLPAPTRDNPVPSKPDNQDNFIPFKFEQRLPLPPPPPAVRIQAPNSQAAYVPLKPAAMPEFVTKLPSPAPSPPLQESYSLPKNAPEANQPVVIPSSKLPQRAIDELLARREQLRQPSSVEKTNGSTLVALTEDLRKWFTDVNPTSWQKVAISPSYPRQACPKQLEGTASVAFLANPKGDIISGPRLIKTTGSDILDQAALAAVKAYQLNPKSDPRQAYLFGVEFKRSSSNCADTSQPAIEEPNSTTPQPTPGNIDSVTPQATPMKRNLLRSILEENNSPAPQATPKKRNSLRSILKENNSASPQATPEDGSSEQPKP